MRPKEVEEIAHKLSDTYGIHLTKSTMFNKLHKIDQQKVRKKVYELQHNLSIG
jgi:hypothetical protein